MSARPTIYDVARLAGVAPSTVSRAFARPGRVNAETARRVFEAAEQLDYRTGTRAAGPGRRNCAARRAARRGGVDPAPARSRRARDRRPGRRGGGMVAGSLEEASAMVLARLGVPEAAWVAVVAQQVREIAALADLPAQE